MVGFADCGMTNSQLFIVHRRRRPFNIQHSTFNIIKAYEKEFLGSRDSHSDSGADGGTDRTGNDLMHGLRPILEKKESGQGDCSDSLIVSPHKAIK